ncbi:hypothetical protein, partial [Limosilactobacillus fermentum]|uniref:hypothetical protein n=1 Tax=Limosilactobacillus fermentum TaxID=1613 RepID=UPI003B9F04B7
KLVHGESLRILIGFLAISIIRGRLSLFQYPQGINLHKIFYTPFQHEPVPVTLLEFAPLDDARARCF